MLTSLSYFAAQIVSITCLTLMALAYLISKPKSLNARLFGILCLSTITYLIATMQYKSDPAFQIDLSAYWLPMQFLMNTGAGCLMILCFSLFQDTKRFPPLLLGVYGGQLLLSTFRPLFVPNQISDIDIESIGAVNYFLFGSLPILLQSAFALVGGYWVIKGWQTDVVESRRLLRWVFLVGLILLFFGGTFSELFVMSGDSNQQLMISLYKTYGSMLGIFILALCSLRFEPFIEVVSKSITQKEDAKLANPVNVNLDTFYRVFRDQKAYLEPGLSIADLAKKLAIPQYKLRHLINQELGYRNFNALLNEYRVKDACEKLSDPAENQTPVLTIALTVGYQSIAPFNQAFRELKDTTPTEYRKRAQQSDASLPLTPHTASPN